MRSARAWCAASSVSVSRGGQRERAAADLRDPNERLREADRRKDEFLAMLAHELRNPLATPQARTLREQPGRLQLFAVSGYAQPEDVKEAVGAGFDAHIAKPLDIAKLERLLA